jgi:hypothetical protein
MVGSIIFVKVCLMFHGNGGGEVHWNQQVAGNFHTLQSCAAFFCGVE